MTPNFDAAQARIQIPAHLDFETYEQGAGYLAVRRHLLSKKCSIETRLALRHQCREIFDKMVFLHDKNENRATGRSTRLVDQFVQELFAHKKVLVQDHWWEGKDPNIFMANRHVLGTLQMRLASEHKLYESRDYEVIRDIQKKELWLKLK